MKAVLSRQFLDAFNNKGEDFAFQFEGTPTRLTIPWCDIICASNTVMIFGAPFSQARSFPELFRKKKAQDAHHIFCQFASEYYGDSWACAMLCIAFQQARLDAAVADLVVLSEDGSTSLPNSIFKESSFNTTEVQRFQYFFDRYCEYAFRNCMNQYNDYSQPLILLNDFMNYLKLSKTIFRDQWAFL